MKPVYQHRTRELAAGRVVHTTWLRDDTALTYADVVALWRDDATFRQQFIAALKEIPFVAFRWETPVVDDARRSRVFEYVCIDSPGLAPRPDRAPFATQIEHATTDVVAFRNLGGDAILVVPAPLTDDATYAQIGAFVRGAPEAQQHALWREVGTQMTARIGARPVWLSTAGAGVSWLHVRLDDRPKYYSHRAYAHE